MFSVSIFCQIDVDVSTIDRHTEQYYLLGAMHQINVRRGARGAGSPEIMCTESENDVQPERVLERSSR